MELCIRLINQPEKVVRYVTEEGAYGTIKGIPQIETTIFRPAALAFLTGVHPFM